jgi:hypothetical protein
LFGLVALLMPATVVLFAVVPAIFAAVHLVCGEVRRMRSRWCFCSRICWAWVSGR